MGTSLVPLLKTPSLEWDRPSLTTHGLGNHAVRNERWRYIRYVMAARELYDHCSDPNEWHNLATTRVCISHAELAQAFP